MDISPKVTAKFGLIRTIFPGCKVIYMGLLANHLQSPPVSKPCFCQPKRKVSRETWPITSLDTFVHTTIHVNREETREKMAKTWGARRCHAPLCHFENFQVNISNITLWHFVWKEGNMWVGRDESKRQGLNLSGSWQQGHSATYNTPSRI